MRNRPISFLTQLHCHHCASPKSLRCAKSLQWCPTLCNPMDYSPPGSSVHGILQVRILEWLAIPSSRQSSWSRNQTCISYISCIGWWVLHHFSSVQFSHSVLSDSLWPHEPQHTTPPCPSPTPGVHPNSCPLCQWCHPTISSSVIPFSSCPQSFPVSWSFQMGQLSASGGQSIGVSASTSVLPMNTQGLSPLGWTGWISLH